MLIANGDIRLIGFIVSATTAVLVVFVYHKIVVSFLCKKIKYAVESGDKTKAYNLFILARRKGYKDKVLHNMLDEYIEKFSINTPDIIDK